ncbi:MAG: histidine utilization repressor [Gammaproteobacteria bacterium]|nr:histidine utilization repressor [Gammaproteobacteria bacterium]MDH3856455.1 histidine utilization repressor [Gammaproteobacteria bacterium]
MNAILDSFDDISKASPEPIYQQIKKTIQRRIESGDWVAGQKLPSENDLVAALDVSRMTINRALRELTQQGLIKRVHGLGSFVAEAPRHASLIELQDIALEIAQDGKRHSSQVLDLEAVSASPDVAAQMELPTGSQVYYLRAVHHQDGLPIQLESRYVNPAVMPGFIDQDFTVMTATAYLLQQFKPDEMEHRVRAAIPDQAVRELLALQNGEPCLQLTRRTWSNGQVVTYVRLTYPGDRYELAARYATTEYQLR